MQKPLFSLSKIIIQQSPSNSQINESTNSQLSLSSNPFTYDGYYTDTESGNYYLNARYYDPTLGIFLTSDSYNLPNRYMYVNGNPVMRVDPNGHIYRNFFGGAFHISLGSRDGYHIGRGRYEEAGYGTDRSPLNQLFHRILTREQDRIYIGNTKQAYYVKDARNGTYTFGVKGNGGQLIETEAGQEMNSWKPCWGGSSFKEFYFCELAKADIIPKEQVEDPVRLTTADHTGGNNDDMFILRRLQKDNGDFGWVIEAEMPSTGIGFMQYYKHIHRHDVPVYTHDGVYHHNSTIKFTQLISLSNSVQIANSNLYWAKGLKTNEL